jgi:predicted O-methyltransferase YrrM
MTPLKSYINDNVWLIAMTQQAAWGLTDHINNLGKDTVGVEVGVDQGNNSYMLLEACPNIKKMIGVDPYQEYSEDKRLIPRSHMDKTYDVLCENMGLMGERFEHLRLSSREAAALIPDDSIDFVFIDADVAIKSVLSYLDDWFPKIKKGGMVSGHDIGYASVHMALQSWARRRGIDKNKILIAENQAWYWFKE